MPPSSSGGIVLVETLGILGARYPDAASMTKEGRQSSAYLHVGAVGLGWLRAAVGVSNESHPLVRTYHRLLVWDITAHTPFTRVPEAVLNPVMGKSLVVYARRSAD